MNLPTNLSKSCLLATVIFWTIIGAYEGVDTDLIPFVFVSVIPIFFVVTVVIVGTICPFIWLKETPSFDKVAIFKTYHPYYANITFGICIYGIIEAHFETYAVAFFAAAFITTNQSWVWFAKESRP